MRSGDPRTVGTSCLREPLTDFVTAAGAALLDVSAALHADNAPPNSEPARVAAMCLPFPASRRLPFTAASNISYTNIDDW
jgi:hypothetical protein